MLLRTSLVAAAALSIFATAPALAQNTSGERGFVPDTGQINTGVNSKLPTSQTSQPAPTRADVLSAMLMTDPGTISTGPSPSTTGVMRPTTNGANFDNAGESGPIGSTMQTTPAKFSRRNDIIDRVPTMAMPIVFDAQQRQQIFRSIMADKTAAISGQGELKPADALPFRLIGDMHPLPASVGNVPISKNLGYLKTSDKVYLVTAATTIVVDVFDGK